MNLYKPATILVAEDNTDDAFFLRRAFTQAGISNTLHFVRDGQQMVDYLSAVNGFADRKAHPFPNLVLLDLKMPRMNGFDALYWIRAQQGFKRLPIIVLTSSADERDINKAYELGANSYLVKPHGMDELTALVTCLKHYWIDSNVAPDSNGPAAQHP